MQAESLDAAFAALSDPTRRQFVCELARGPRSIGQLAEGVSISLPAVSRHIKVLEHAGLVTQGQRAQYRPCAIDATPLREIASWAERYRPIWEGRFDQLESYLHQLDSGHGTDHPNTDHPDIDHPNTDQKDDV